MLEEDKPQNVYVTPKEASTNTGSIVKSIQEAKDEHVNL